jgi:hypothetical protein
LSRQIPFGRLAAEFVVIVVGVLVALAADAWWDGRQDLALERNVLTSLVEELRANRVRLQNKVQWREGIHTASSALLEAAVEGPDSLTPDSLDHLIGDQSWWSFSADLEMSTLQAAVSAGQLTVIRSDDIRRALASWQSVVLQMDQVEAQSYDWYLDVFMPYMREQGNLPQLANAITHMPGRDEPTFATPVPVGPALDHRPLLLDQEFINVTLQGHWVSQDLLYRYDTLDDELVELIDLLEAELAG